MPHPATHSSADSEETEMDWAADAACRNQTRIYFAPVGSGPFFCEQLLPVARGLVPAVTAGAEPLFALGNAQLCD